jgi:hypothetical protein
MRQVKCGRKPIAPKTNVKLESKLINAALARRGVPVLTMAERRAANYRLTQARKGGA